MNFILQPWQLLFVILASWVNRQQRQVNDYLVSVAKAFHSSF